MDSRRYDKKSDIKISVVIPALNEERYLGACLESLRRQDFDLDYEIIVVDNGSADATIQIARQYGVRVIYEPRRGVCYARQAGTMEAKGQIIVSIDADSVFPAAWLENISRLFSSESKIVGVAGPIRFEPRPFWGYWWSIMLFGIVGFVYRVFGVVLYASACNFAFKKSAWEAAGGYNVRLTQGGDEYDLLRRLRSVGQVVFIPDNASLTSSRRLRRGIFYSFFATLCYYYLLDYFVFSRFAGQSFTGTYPEFREEKRAKPVLFLRPAKFIIIIAVVVFVVGWFGFPRLVLAHPVKQSFRANLSSLERKCAKPIRILDDRLDDAARFVVSRAKHFKR